VDQLRDSTTIPSPKRDVSGRGSLIGVLRSIRYPEIALFQTGPLLGLAFAGGLQWQHGVTILTFLVGNVLLFTFIFAFNDWGNLNRDLEDPTRAHGTFLRHGATPSGMLTLSILSASASLFFLALCSISCLMLGLVLVALGLAYSLPGVNHKAVPFFSSINHFTGGVSQFLLGYAAIQPVDSPAVVMSLYIALVLVAGHLVQELRDYAGDSVTGVQTHAVRFGQRRTLAISTLLFTLSYSGLAGMAAVSILSPIWMPLSLMGLIQAAALFRVWRSDLTQRHILQYQTTYRILHLLIGLLMVYGIVICSGGLSA